MLSSRPNIRGFKPVEVDENVKFRICLPGGTLTLDAILRFQTLLIKYPNPEKEDSEQIFHQIISNPNNTLCPNFLGR